MSSTCCQMIFPLSLLLIILLPASISASHFDWSPRLRISRDSSLLDSGAVAAAESVLIESPTFFFNQTLDHFNYRPDSYTTFRQKYVVNSTYWGGANSSAPIFAYLGAEGPLAGEIPAVGFLTDNAPRFKALLVYIEHRFYGESIPYGLSLEEALQDPDTRGYFNSAQALADYAAVIVYVKKTLQAHDSPVIVFGASYGGMLASWFRLKYPHIAHGALASSAPILLPVNFTLHYGYYHIVSKGFWDTSETCYGIINSSWSVIDWVASQDDGLLNLSKTFKTCKPLEHAYELKNYLISMYIGAAQYNDPFHEPVAKLCDAINSSGSSSILGKIFAGVVAYKVNSPCYVNPPTNASQTSLGWSWQTCSDIMQLLGRDNKTMFQPSDISPRSYIEYCKSSYGVDPRIHWVSTYYGGQNIKRILRRFGSNIIFSNGLKDPYSSDGDPTPMTLTRLVYLPPFFPPYELRVLEDISDTILAVYTTNGSHCLDIAGATANDPDWLVEQRKTEVEILEKWILTYYDDLKEKA